MEVRALVRKETDPVEGPILEHVMDVPDGTDLESVVDLGGGISAAVQDIDGEDSELPRYTFYVTDTEFKTLDGLWQAAAA